MQKKKSGILGADKITPAAAIGGLKGTIGFLFTLSGVINVLALTGAFYMLQIYDRALTSHSVPTLVALSVLAIGLYLFQGMLDVTRSQILVRVGAQLDQKLAPLAHKVTIDMPRFGFSMAEAKDRGSDVDTIRQFLSGQGPMALFDLPWMPMYVLFVYMLHPWLGLLTLAGAVVLASLTLLTEILTKSRSQEAQQADINRANVADSHARNADVLCAMGFAGRAVARFEQANSKNLSLHTKAFNITGSLSGLSRVLRMMLQSAVLGLGAYLTIQGALTAGAIIAASVAAARALAPIDLAIGQWKSVVAARRSYHRLGETLSALENEDAFIQLDPPTKDLKIEKITVAAPGTGTVVLSDVVFELKAGQALGIIGPTGGGKSSLVRGVTGVWPLVRGSIRLDDADRRQWSPDHLGQHIGYLPQDVALLDATIAENICRLDPEVDDAKILAAAAAAGVHELIVRLSDGYQTQLGPGGTALSAGQRQRIGLARALYDNPFLVVLDEPNSNLDADGEKALTEAISGIRERGGIAIVVAHRPSALTACDLVGVIKEGRLAAFGPKDEIINGVRPITPGSEAPTAPRKPASPLRVTGGKSASAA
ncbi:MAG: PrtD family type I secretion system ABC transporter [Alphaproteobacteria bacterium]